MIVLQPATGIRIHVVADDGVIRLRLEMVSTAQRAEAERLARWIAGPAVREIDKPGLPPQPRP